MPKVVFNEGSTVYRKDGELKYTPAKVISSSVVCGQVGGLTRIRFENDRTATYIYPNEHLERRT